MLEVKMNVQTMYKGELLRAGKTYLINKKTAEKWIISNIATSVEKNATRKNEKKIELTNC